MRKEVVGWLLLGLVLSISANVYAASSGDDGDTAPPSTSGGSGGGGSPQFFDYYVPLVFDSSHVHGISEIVIWSIQPTTIIGSFSLDEAGTNVINLQEPSKLSFNPTNNRGLTNGSLIRSTSPLLIIGQRATEDIFYDHSFAYSILSDRMMGFEFIAPKSGFVNIMTSQQGVIVKIANPSDEVVFERTLNRPFIPVSIPVEKGTYINGTGPLSGAFISYEGTTEASMAVPKYLRGDNYLIPGNMYIPYEDEIDNSYISVLIEQPTKLFFTFENGSKSSIDIFTDTKFNLDPNLRAINSSRGDIDVSIHTSREYGGLTRGSMVQLFAGSEMRAGEIFVSPKGYSSHYVVPQENTSLTQIKYNGTHPFVPGYLSAVRNLINTSIFDTYNMVEPAVDKILIANDSLFGITTLPGRISHPMDASLSFLNIPVNSQTSKNISGLESTWYRFPNLAVGNITVVPGPIEEYTGQIIRVEILSNGSLPSSKFTTVIIIDEEEPFEFNFDFIPANTTVTFEFERFMEYGKDKINVTVNIDELNEVNEINEDDNYDEGNFNVVQNIRLRFSVILLIVLVITYSFTKIMEWSRNQRKITRAHVDVLITDEVDVE